MTRTEIKTDIRSLLAEPNTDFLTDAKLNVAIYEAMLTMAKKTKAHRSSSSVNSVSGTAEYAFPSNAVGVMAITWGTNEDELYYRREYEMDRDFPSWRATTNTTNQGTPEFWLLGYQTNYYRLHPVPNATTAHKVYWWGIPSDLASDSSSPTFNSAFHRGLAYYACWFLLMGDPDGGDTTEKRAAFFLNIFERYVADYSMLLSAPGKGPNYILSTAP